MSVPKPPFHSASEELLYNIYLKIQDMDALKETDINTLAKLNAILTDGDLITSDAVLNAIASVKGNVPAAADTLEKLYAIVQGLGSLKDEDIDTLAELNAILNDGDVASLADLSAAIQTLKGNVPESVNTLEKLYNATWLTGGNTVGSAKSIGTKDNFELPFITGNIERARITNTGALIIGKTAPITGLESYKLHVPEMLAHLAYRGLHSSEMGVYSSTWEKKERP